MSESHTKLEELPFSFQGVEEKYGSLIDAEELCPLCRKHCPLSDPQCDKPYLAGLIAS